MDESTFTLAFPSQTEKKKTLTISISISGAPQEVRTQNFPYTNLESYRCNSLFGVITVGNNRGVGVGVGVGVGGN
jgi:hypothetical protein